MRGSDEVCNKLPWFKPPGYDTIMAVFVDSYGGLGENIPSWTWSKVGKGEITASASTKRTYLIPGLYHPSLHQWQEASGHQRIQIDLQNEPEASSLRSTGHTAPCTSMPCPQHRSNTEGESGQRQGAHTSLCARSREFLHTALLGRNTFVGKATGIHLLAALRSLPQAPFLGDLCVLPQSLFIIYPLAMFMTSPGHSLRWEHGCSLC